MKTRQPDLFLNLPSKKADLEDFPEILSEWNYSKNSGINPLTFSAGSHKKVWWVCALGHEWVTEIRLRTRRGYGCPFCAGTIPSEERNFGDIFPELVSQWDYEKNPNLPQDYTPNSGKKVWWRCGKGHSFQASIDARTPPKSSGCPYCANKKPSDDNNLVTAFPDVASEWHPSKNGHKVPHNYLPSSNKKAWWRCSSGHSYEAQIASRTLSRTGCPYCSGKKPTSENNLKTKFPDLSAEWHPRNTNPPETYVPGSNKKVWWRCRRGHEWAATIAKRTIDNRGCPYCSNQSSRGELRLFAELSALFEGVEHRGKISGKEFDVVVHSQKVAIEYDGSYWHLDKAAHDEQKNSIAINHGYRILRVRERPLKRLSNSDIIIDRGALPTKAQLNQVVSIVDLTGGVAETYRKKKSFIAEEKFLCLLEALPGPLPGRSFADDCGSILAEWHPVKNLPLTPFDFGPSSTHEAWWICSNNHEWKASILSRNKQGQSCQICRSIITTHPTLASLWSTELNEGVELSMVRGGSDKRYHWQCTNNPLHIWQQSPSAMTNSRAPKVLCPFCRRQKRTATV